MRAGLHNTLAIARKEIWVYLTTWTSYILVGAFLEVTAFFFYLLIKEFQARRLLYAERHAVGVLQQMSLTDLVVGPTFSYVATFFIFLLPVLTMRLVAGERQGKTFELLMTTPARPIEVVVGKYLAAWSMMFLMLALTVVFPLSLHLFAGGGTALDWSTVAVGYSGMVLLGSAGVAVGLLASSVTDSQFVAVVTGFAALLLLTVIGVAATGQSEPWRSVLEELSISHHLNGFIRGLIRSPDVIYYLSLSFLGLFFAHRAVAAQRWR